MITTIIKIVYCLLTFIGGVWLVNTGLRDEPSDKRDLCLFSGFAFSIIAFICLTIIIMTLKP